MCHGNQRCLWDRSQGNPQLITAFPAPDAIKGYTRVQPEPARLIAQDVALDCIAHTQMPAYGAEAGWKDETQRPDFVQEQRLRFLRFLCAYPDLRIRVRARARARCPASFSGMSCKAMPCVST